MNYNRASLRMKDSDRKRKIKSKKYKEQYIGMSYLLKQDKTIIGILNKLYPYKVIAGLRFKNTNLYSQISICAYAHNMGVKKYIESLGFKMKKITNADIVKAENEIFNILNITS